MVKKICLFHFKEFHSQASKLNQSIAEKKNNIGTQSCLSTISSAEQSEFQCRDHQGCETGIILLTVLFFE